MKLLIVGAGGIGGYVAIELHRLVMNGQIDLDTHFITLIDDDVVELKNIKYQNFTNKDIGEPKAEVLGQRYFFDYVIGRVTDEKQLKDYDFFVICVDNAKTRELIFRYCEQNGKYFIDARAEGRAICIFTKHKNNSIDKLLKTLSNVENTSCQLKFELDNGIIQNGNVIVATMVSQLILNKLRGIDNPSDYNFYF